MSARLRAATIAVLLGAGTLALYARQLDRAPIYLAHDEVDVAVEGYSVATTGRSTSGQHLPLYFRTPAFEAGRDPISIYLTALVLKLRPLSEAAIRFPSALVGVLNVVLLFFVGRELFGRDDFAFVAAAALALAPAHFIHSRIAETVIYTLPFVELWLLCLTIAVKRGSAWWCAAAGLTLGLGVYSYVAAIVMMPLYFATSALVLWASGLLSVRRILALVASSAFALVPLVAWQFAHPARVQQLVGYYRIYDSRLSVIQGAHDLSSYFSLSVRSDVYWRFFSPAFLYFSGDSGLINSTRQAGVFPLGFVVLLPVGLFWIAMNARKPIPLAILAGFFIGPVAAVIVGDISVPRALFMLPFGVLVAAYGAAYLLSAGGWKRWVCVAALVAIPLHFARFAGDYFSDYRMRSIPWFDDNVRGALADVVAKAPPGRSPQIYLSADIPLIDRYWRLYTDQWRRPDLLDQAVYQGARQIDAAHLRSGSLILLYASDPLRPELLKSAGLSETPAGMNPNGTSSFSLLEKN